MKKVYEKPVIMLADKVISRYAAACEQPKENKEPAKKQVCG